MLLQLIPNGDASFFCSIGSQFGLLREKSIQLVYQFPVDAIVIGLGILFCFPFGKRNVIIGLVRRFQQPYADVSLLLPYFRNYFFIEDSFGLYNAFGNKLAES